jgi:prephenate dehydrogenase
VFAQLTILAPGLLGGSVAQAAKAKGAVGKIVVWARRPEDRQALRGQTWCDGVADSPEEAVLGATLIIVAAPVDRIVPLVGQVIPFVEPTAIVTDVGSVKGEIVRQASAALRGHAHFVGSHPMAGSEKTGWQHATPTLFERRTCFVTPNETSDANAVEALVRFWTDLGADVVTVDPDKHDEIVAHVSHLPQVLASNLCAYLATKNPHWRNLAGNGLRDTTRIAASDPRIWKSILEQNRDEVLRALREYQDELQAFHSALSNRDYLDVVARLERGKAYRDQFRPSV